MGWEGGVLISMRRGKTVLFFSFSSFIFLLVGGSVTGERMGNVEMTNIEKTEIAILGSLLMVMVSSVLDSFAGGLECHFKLNH